MRNFTWNRFPIKNLLIDSLLTPIVESTYLNFSKSLNYFGLWNDQVTQIKTSIALTWWDMGWKNWQKYSCLYAVAAFAQLLQPLHFQAHFLIFLLQNKLHWAVCRRRTAPTMRPRQSAQLEEMRFYKQSKNRQFRSSLNCHFTSGALQIKVVSRCNEIVSGLEQPRYASRSSSLRERRHLNGKVFTVSSKLRY